MSIMKYGQLADSSLFEIDNAIPGKCHSGIFSCCPNQEIGWPFQFKGLILGTCSYFGAEAANYKMLKTLILLS
jgi:hypothetical protein